jgi:hypothetical protein
MTLPPPTGSSRPAPPPLRLPLPRRRPGGFIASILLHSLILLLIGRFGVQWVLGGGDDRNGPLGGGGAGGAVHFIDLPAAAASAPQTVVPPPVHTVPPPEIAPAPTLTPPTITPLSTTLSPVVAATDGTTGQGPGTGGGTGSGAGTGVGTDSGPGSGGNGAYITPPSLRTLLIQPACARGRITVQFAIAADGSVTQVKVVPEPKDGACRRELMEKMRGYQFLPARTRDGRAVAATFQVILGQ